MNPVTTATESLDYRVLCALARYGALSLSVLAKYSSISESIPAIQECLNRHLAANRINIQSSPDGWLWKITPAGQAWLAFNAMPRPMSATVCNRQEPSIPSTAFLCVSEDEVDDWWAGLDVEAKADAFITYSLRAQGQADSYIHVPGLELNDPPARVPVAGTIGGVDEHPGKAVQQ